eukprot:scaffold8128_cov60-Cylindrotheca_fusiformis.AAC.5
MQGFPGPSVGTCTGSIPGNINNFGTGKSLKPAPLLDLLPLATKLRQPLLLPYWTSWIAQGFCAVLVE